MNNLQNVAFFLIVVVFGAIILIEGAFILIPLVWGVFFAVTLNPVASWLERKRIPRGIAIFVSIMLFSIMAFGIFYLLINQMIGLIKEIPEIGSNLEVKFSRYIQEFEYLLGEDFIQSGQGFSFFPTENLNQTLIETGKSITLAGIIPLFTFLLMYYKDFFIEFLLRYTASNKEIILKWATDSGFIIQSYLVGMIRVTAIVAVLAGVFFYLQGIKYFILFALFIAIMNLIPYVGVFISSFFIILYVFLTTDSLFYPILTFAVLWGIQLLENNVITPLVVGSKVKVNALAVIFAILLGGWLWGISGMVLFIPIVGVLKITLERSKTLSAFGYLLGDDIPVTEESENYWKLLQRRLSKK